MELIDCQTCENCYHTDCMTPSPESIPSFWFCPHCTDREWNVPPESSSSAVSQTAKPDPIPQEPSPSATVARFESSHKAGNKSLEEPDVFGNIKSKRKFTTNIARALYRPNGEAERPKPKRPEPKSAPSRTRRSYSPPRKKSKYSAFSSEVDKALVVIQKELEFAAGLGKSEDALQDRIKSLEQELKLKDGHIMLSTRELDLAKKHSSGSSRLKSENITLREENEKLLALVEKKDQELRDWRMKLRSMIGDDLDG